jgi:hypothetical protein
MNHRTGLDRSQTLLFPERLEDYVAAENPVRFLDAFVGTQDLHTLGFAKAQVATTGRPPYDPADLLKLYLYGYTHFLLKGLEKVRTEWSLTTLAYNLKRVLNLVSFEKLMLAVGVKVPQRA